MENNPDVYILGDSESDQYLIHNDEAEEKKRKK